MKCGEIRPLGFSRRMVSAIREAATIHSVVVPADVIAALISADHSGELRRVLDCDSCSSMHGPSRELAMRLASGGFGELNADLIMVLHATIRDASTLGAKCVGVPHFLLACARIHVGLNIRSDACWGGLLVRVTDSLRTDCWGEESAGNARESVFAMALKWSQDAITSESLTRLRSLEESIEAADDNAQFAVARELREQKYEALLGVIVRVHYLEATVGHRD